MTHRLLARAASAFALAAALAFQGAPAFAQAQPASAAAVAPAAVPRAEGAGPALWVVKDADSTIWLFGTVHVLRPTTAWGSDKVDAAFAEADQFWMELADPGDQAAALPLIYRYGIDMQTPLTSYLTVEETARLSEAAQASGLSVQQLSVMKPWLAAMTLSVAPSIKAGYDPMSGVEPVLKARAEAAGIPIRGVETIDQQIQFLAGLSPEIQLEFLRYTLENYEDATAELDRMVDAWARGDTSVLEETTVDGMREEGEELYQTLLVRRNADWAEQIDTLLDGSGEVFIAVGSAHLAGPDSVQAELAKRGIQTERVE